MRFKDFGLSVSKNMLVSPECPCGCGGKVHLLLKTKEDVYNLIWSVLQEEECCHCAIFAKTLKGEVIWGIKYGTQDVNLLSMESMDKKLFSEIAIEFELHKYGLIVEVENGSWEIIEK